jgi:hypothetical protein
VYYPIRNFLMMREECQFVLKGLDDRSKKKNPIISLVYPQMVAPTKSIGCSSVVEAHQSNFTTREDAT